MGLLVPATPAHAAALAAIHAEAFPPAGQWGVDAMALQLSLPGAFGWIDPEGGLILSRVAADEAEVLTLAVAPAVRRRGVGRALLAAGLRMAGERGGASMVLEVAVDNGAARGLYSAAGFVQVGLRRNYYGAGLDAVIMRAPCG